MSYENVPKNLAEKAVLIRKGQPDYSKLEADAFPTPTAAEQGAILENTDTGDRYRWTSTKWVKVVTAGADHVHDPNVGSSIIDRYFIGDPSISTTIAIAASSQDRVINVTSAAGMLAGDNVELNGLNLETSFPQIISIAVNAVTLDRLIDSDHDIGSAVNIVPINMAVVGSAGTPVYYRVAPIAGQVFHITRLLFSMTHGTAGDLGLFGNLAALTNGVGLRTFINGKYRTITNWKANADISTDMYDIKFDTRSGGGGTFGTTARFTLAEAGSVIVLDGDIGDTLEIIIQDDLSALTTFDAKAQGHIENV